MAIYRGNGGAGDATNDITINQITELSSEAQISADAAASSATSASSSASAASTSATNAANSATAASTSETNAATSETNAATSASNASTSETNAAASETAAAASETAAGLSETAAAASETNAATSATNAATSETNANTSATSAASSASSASTSATNAATSETNAASSASNAATSETNAATSETNAAASATAAAASAASAASSDYATSSWYTTTNNSSNWNTAYGWGDHASAGYLVDSNNLSDLNSAATALTNLGIANHDDITVDGSGTVTTNGLVISDANPGINFTDTTNNFDAYITAENGNLELNSDSNGESGSASSISLKVDNTEYMRINSSGKVGIGTSSPSTILHTRATTPVLTVDGSAFSSSSNGTGFGIYRSAAGRTAGYTWIIENDISSGGSLASHYQTDDLLFKARASITDTTLTEHMRIVDTGELLLGTTSKTVGGVTQKGLVITKATRLVALNKTAPAGATMINFLSSGTQVGSIISTASATSYNTSSDYRLKEDVQPMEQSIERVKQLNPVNFAWKLDGSRVDGFLAHEAADVVPEAVSGTKDAVQLWEEDDELPEGAVVGDNKLDDDGNTIPDYQSIDQSKLVPLLTSALQEAIGRIETLEAEVTALKG